MPRHFFDLQDHEVVFDHAGTELRDDDVARIGPVGHSGAYLRDHPELVWDGRELRVHVVDERRPPLLLVAILGVDLQRNQRAGPVSS